MQIKKFHDLQSHLIDFFTHVKQNHKKGEHFTNPTK